MIAKIVDLFITMSSPLYWAYFAITTVLLIAWIGRPIVCTIKNVIRFIFLTSFSEKRTLLSQSASFAVDAAVYFFRDSITAPIYAAQVFLLLFPALGFMYLSSLGELGGLAALLIFFSSIWAFFRLNSILTLATQGEKERKAANTWASRYYDLAKHCAELEEKLQHQTEDV